MMKQTRIQYFFCGLGVILALITLACPTVAVAQQAQESFGKNRVQYIDYDWQVLGSKNYDVYFYEGGEQTARMAAYIAESEFRRITNLIGYFPYAKIRIYVYNNELEKLQSNIGFNPDEQMTGGETQFLKSEVEVAFNGSYKDLRDDLIYKISWLMITDMMYGGSFKEVVQSTYFLNLPDWFINGAAAYVTFGWDERMDDHMRDAVLSRGVKKPSRLIGTDAQLAGQSIWNYIAVRYGESNISNVLNLTRIIRDEESSITNTLALSYRTFIRDWRNYYLFMADLMAESERYVEDDKRIKRNAGERDFSMIRISKDGRFLAMVQEKDGRYQVKVRDIESGKTRTVERAGIRLRTGEDSPVVPVIAWDANGKLHYVRNLHDHLFEETYDPVERKSSKSVALPDFDGVHGFAFSSVGGYAVYSVVQDGQSDLYLYSQGRFSRLTSDIYADLYPTFSADGDKVYFSSDRKADTANLKVTPEVLSDNFDLFSIETLAKAGTPVRVLRTPYNETRPMVTDDNVLLFRSDRSGISNLYRLEGTEAVPLTNYQQGLRAFDYDPGAGKLLYVANSDHKERVFFRKDLPYSKPVVINRTPRQEYLDNRKGIYPSVRMPSYSGEKTKETKEAKEQLSPAPPTSLLEGEIDYLSYQFESDRKAKEAAPKETDQPESVIIINPKRGPADRTVSDNEDPFTAVAEANSRMAIYNTTTSFLVNPINGFGVQLGTGLSDMLGNHRINATAIFYGDLNSTLYDAEYLYLKHRLDYGLKFKRKTIFTSEDNVLQRYALERYEAMVSYPLSISARFSLSPVHLHTRYSKILPLDTFPDPKSDYIGIKAQFVYDNTVSHGLNMNEGTKLKLSYEFNEGIKASGNSFGKINFDLRHYQPLHRDLVLAVRVSYGQFLGPAKKDFLLGGMDNWLFNSRAPEGDPLAGQFMPIDNRDLLFVEYVTNLRGFEYNALVGNSYSLMNAELRFPIVKYFSNRPVSSGFLQNLQFVGFTDVGTAWSGISPFNEKNSFNTRTVTDQSFQATVYNYRNAFLIGYGGGVRTLMFGFYFKFDVAWGIEDYEVNKPKFYLTLGYDF